MTARMKLQRQLSLAGCAVAIIGSVAGLAVATGEGAVDKTVTNGLPSVISAWRGESQVRAAAEGHGLSPAAMISPLPARTPPVSGDEGFWLNAKALAGSDGAVLTVGEHMTIADRTYVIAELRPLATDTEANAARHVTLVVARETGQASAPSRTIRFLIDAEQVAPRQEPVATAPASPHSTL